MRKFDFFVTFLSACPIQRQYCDLFRQQTDWKQRRAACYCCWSIIRKIYSTFLKVKEPKCKQKTADSAPRTEPAVMELTTTRTFSEFVFRWTGCRTSGFSLQWDSFGRRNNGLSVLHLPPPPLPPVLCTKLPRSFNSVLNSQLNPTGNISYKWLIPWYVSDSVMEPVWK